MTFLLPLAITACAFVSCVNAAKGRPVLFAYCTWAFVATGYSWALWAATT
jgi:hemolysin-activating ACP:hemolysin acyltransferase